MKYRQKRAAQDIKDQAADTYNRVEENVANLPVMSISLAFILGMGTAALLAGLRLFRTPDSKQSERYSI